MGADMSTVAAMRPIVAAMLALLADPVAAAGLEVEVTNLWPSAPVRVELFADATAWHGGAPLASRAFIAQQRQQRVRFDGLPPGRYAVRAVQAGASAAATQRVLPARRGTSGGAFGNPVSFGRAAIEVPATVRVTVRVVPADD